VSRIAAFLIALVGAGLWVVPARGHEVRPAYLELRPAGEHLWHVLGLGVHHILAGADHLLFVLSLLLLVRNMRALLTTITAFTIGHSVTLATAALGHLDLPGSSGG